MVSCWCGVTERIRALQCHRSQQKHEIWPILGYFNSFCRHFELQNLSFPAGIKLEHYQRCYICWINTMRKGKTELRACKCSKSGFLAVNCHPLKASAAIMDFQRFLKFDISVGRMIYATFKTKTKSQFVAIPEILAKNLIFWRDGPKNRENESGPPLWQFLLDRHETASFTGRRQCE